MAVESYVINLFNINSYEDEKNIMPFFKQWRKKFITEQSYASLPPYDYEENDFDFEERSLSKNNYVILRNLQRLVRTASSSDMTYCTTTLFCVHSV